MPHWALFFSYLSSSEKLSELRPASVLPICFGFTNLLRVCFGTPPGKKIRGRFGETTGNTLLVHVVTSHDVGCGGQPVFHILLPDGRTEGNLDSSEQADRLRECRQRRE